ncbi:F-box protein At3g13820-like [Pyrus communis]|uniref:F-box protein At3g13820-like n=1 Tax=Pyrus communis TaxID=23211 RepID=UPI0035C26C3F
MEMLSGIEQQRKKRKLLDCCINNNTSCSSLTSLPTEILIDILLRLPVSSLFCIRCVSKTVLNIVDCPSFVTLHTQRLLTVQATQTNFDDVNQVPKLMHMDHSITTVGYCAFQSVEYDDNKNAFTHKEDDATAPAEFGPPPPRPDGWYEKFEFVFCNLLCFRFFGYRESDSIRFEEPCILVNPLRREVLVLPTTTNAQLPASCPKDSVLDWLAMGLDNVTNHLKIVRVSGNKDYSSQLVAQVHVLGTNSWREVDSVPPCNLSATKLYAYGDMHWLVWSEYEYPVNGDNGDDDGEYYDDDNNNYDDADDYYDYDDDDDPIKWAISIVSFDFSKEEFHQRIPPPKYFGDSYKYLGRGDTPPAELKGAFKNNLFYLHLVNLRGYMALVDASSRDHLEIWVLKNYHDKNQEWSLEYKVETTIIYGRDTPFYQAWVPLKCYQWAHGIFFNEHGGATRSTYFLDLRSGSTTKAELFPSKTVCTSILSYTPSLISLRNYGSLVQGQPTTASITSAEGKNLVYLMM